MENNEIIFKIIESPLEDDNRIYRMTYTTTSDNAILYTSQSADGEGLTEEERQEILKLIDKLEEELFSEEKNKRNETNPSEDKYKRLGVSKCVCASYELLKGCGCGGGKKEIRGE